ncbi:MAG TPA: hypothetical protein VFS58_10530, partial [Steroidobacteraceae bacterium]|nr:hypothetical protein [Steroidobacteraceae bacterium]
MTKDPVAARVRASSMLLFLVLVPVALAIWIFGASVFPGDRAGAQASRLLCSAAAAMFLIFGSRRLLQRDGLATDRLGLALTAAHGKAFV